MKNPRLREKFAELAHEQWSGWMHYLFEKCDLIDDNLIVPKWARLRWGEQMITRYADLSEEEKDSDRVEADKMLEVTEKHINQLQSELEVKTQDRDKWRPVAKDTGGRMIDIQKIRDNWKPEEKHEHLLIDCAISDIYKLCDELDKYRLPKEGER